MGEKGSFFHVFHFRDKEIGGKHGMCCEFSMTMRVGVYR